MSYKARTPAGRTVCARERPHGTAPSSSQAPYAPGRPLLALWANSPSRSLPPNGESSLIPLLLLSPRDPLRWARAGTPSWLPPSRGPTPLVKGRCRAATEGIGKLSSEARLMRVPTEGMPLSSAPSSGPAGGHMGPPLRKFRPVVVRRGRCPHRPEPAARPGGRALQNLP